MLKTRKLTNQQNNVRHAILLRWICVVFCCVAILDTPNFSTANSVPEVVKSIIVERLGGYNSQVTSEENLVADLGIDTLAKLN